MEARVSGIVSGLAGTIVLLVVLTLAETVTGFAVRSYVLIAEYLGSAESILLGLAVFVAGWGIIFPLLYVSANTFLPGKRAASRGMMFAIFVWIVFLGFFSPGFGAAGYTRYTTVTLFGHLIYGAILGEGCARLCEQLASTRASGIQRG